ncbi:YicC family protein [Ectothiorhodospiraceae bacterium 2226]|nr:YicC family protein [Ectothiorhodospiraceae bacterium 2226]
MVHSMTAFAREEAQGPWGALALELRAVNHRYLEVAPRLPDELRLLEPELRARIQARLARGKVDCTLRYSPPDALAVGAPAQALDTDHAERVAALLAELQRIVPGLTAPDALAVLQWPGVLKPPTPDLATVQAAALALLDRALEGLRSARAREGAELARHIQARCAAMREVAEDARARLPAVLAAARERLRARLEEVRGELEPGRLEQEMVLMAQRLDVDEELARLATHLTEVERVLGEERPVGRRLDFLMQELNREANTLGSKSSDIAMTQAAVELKVLIEQMREQIQNIE